MANYTITRRTESGHLYGCTDFSTNQSAGQTASLAANSPFDATVEWDIKAITGYTVDISNFNIPNTTQPSITSLTEKTFAGAGLPSFVTGVLMRQVSSTLIRALIYLHPESLYNFTGQPYVMPDSNVSETIIIEGCAMQDGVGHHMIINNTWDDETEVARLTTTAVVEDEKSLAVNEISSRVTRVYGTMPSDQPSGFVMSYIAEVSTGYRFKQAPSLSFDSNEYYVETELPESKENISTVTFNIYKK